MKNLCYESTSLCPLKCPYCISRDNGQLVVEKYENIIHFIGEMLPERIVISGGEPLIDPLLKNKISLITEKYHQMGMEPYISLSTSGACYVTPETWSFLKNTIQCFDISIPTLKYDVYQQMRGVDLLDKALGNAYYAASFGLNVRISVILTKQNESEIESILSFAEEIGANSVRIGRYFPFRDANLVKEEYELEEPKVQQIIADIKNDKYKNIFSKKIIPPIQSLDMMEGYLNVDFKGTLFSPSISGKTIFGNIDEVSLENLESRLLNTQQKIFVKTKE